MWDHPCDEQFRELVVRERQLLQAKKLKGGETKKKIKDKKSKDKKNKKESVRVALLSGTCI